MSRTESDGAVCKCGPICAACGRLRAVIDEPTTDPFVPCDDAAVERVAVFLFEEEQEEASGMGGAVTPWTEIPATAQAPYRLRARDALRAAGRTP